MSNPVKTPPYILIVDDEPLVKNILCEILETSYTCITVDSAEQAIIALQNQKFDLVLSDIDMGGMSGIELIPKILESSPDTVVVMISGKQSIEGAIDAMRFGAFDFIRKPFDLEHIEVAIQRAYNHHLLLVEKRRYEYHLEELVKQRTAELNYLSYHDSLTDLPNRILFEDRLSTTLVSARHNQQILAVVFFSFDQFKKIYNTLGNLPGLQLLQEVAERLKVHIPRDTTLARFEADEFALLLTQIENVEDIIEFISKINLALKSPIVVENREVFITASIGISVFPNDGMDTQTLLNNASVALSRVKEQGGNNYEFYATGMNAKAIERLEMENRLRRAVEHKEFEVYYQPKVDINTKRVVGMEALIRWRHPEFGIIQPSDFISLAEETGLIIPIGEWILRAACIQNKIWIEEGFKLEVSVNLSARQFQQPNLLQTITEILEETAYPPELLNLEVTESSIMKNADSAISMLGEIKKKGIKISIDDFGTGYSSLGYLKNLPIDTLKIDKSFVNDVTTNQDDAALVMAIITLAHNLRLKVIAEGVETEEQFRFLHLLRCDECQGYLFSRPVPSVDFKNLLY